MSALLGTERRADQLRIDRQRTQTRLEEGSRACPQLDAASGRFAFPVGNLFLDEEIASGGKMAASFPGVADHCLGFLFRLSESLRGPTVLRPTVSAFSRRDVFRVRGRGGVSGHSDRHSAFLHAEKKRCPVVAENRFEFGCNPFDGLHSDPVESFDKHDLLNAAISSLFVLFC